jgi:hypothetical protein
MTQVGSKDQVDPTRLKDTLFLCNNGTYYPGYLARAGEACAKDKCINGSTGKSDYCSRV